MTIYYSMSRNGFYNSDINGTLPSDAVGVPLNVYQNVLAAQSTGKIITSDVNGNPIAVDPSTPLTLAEARAGQTTLLGQECASAIMSGFSSSALGSAHSYGSQSHDQQNLSDAISASLVPGLATGWTTDLWCAASGVWALAAHTAAQVQAAHSDWIAFRLSQQQRLVSLTAQVNAAASVAAVLAIAW